MIRKSGNRFSDKIMRNKKLAEPAARMSEQEIDTARLRHEIVLQHAPVRIARLGLTEQPLEVADIAIDRHAEICIAIVAACDLVERGLAVEAVDMAPECAAIARPEAIPDIGRGALVDGSCELIEPELIAAAERGGGLLNSAIGEALAALRHSPARACRSSRNCRHERRPPAGYRMCRRAVARGCW